MIAKFRDFVRPLGVALALTCVPAIAWSEEAARGSATKAASQVISVSPSDEYLTKLREDYGEREMKILAADLTREVNRQLRKAGLTQYQVALVIHDAVPNRPTFEQLRENIGLDYGRSFGIGSADVEAKILSPQGEMLRSFRYDWSEFNIEFTAEGADTWYDARRAFYFFAVNLRKDLQKSPPIAEPAKISSPQ